MKLKAAVLDDYQNVAHRMSNWALLEDRVDVTFIHEHLYEEGQILNRLREFEIIVVMRERTRITSAIIAGLPRLRLIVTTGRHNAAVDVGAARRAGITVCATESLPHSTSELTWGLILAITRRIAVEDQAIRQGKWQTSLGRELAGTTLGILGLGNMGRRMVRYADAFDMQSIAWSQNLTPDVATASGTTYVTKRELFEIADIVVILVKLSERTRHIVGAEELRLLGPCGYIVNTARGECIDERALIHALSSGGIAGAALDTFAWEPLPPDHPLRSTPNTLLSPHMGYVTKPNYQRFFNDVVEDIAEWLQGMPVRELDETSFGQTLESGCMSNVDAVDFQTSY